MMCCVCCIMVVLVLLVLVWLRVCRLVLFSDMSLIGLIYRFSFGSKVMGEVCSFCCILVSSVVLFVIL